MANFVKALDNAQGEYVAFLSKSRRQFFAAEQGSTQITCNRNWVQMWEWFTAINKGSYYLIRSDFTGRYMSVRKDGSLYADQTDNVVNARFEINFEEGNIKSVFNRKYLRVNDRGIVSADGEEEGNVAIFQVRTVAVANSGQDKFMTPGTYDGNRALLVNSDKWYEFVILTGDDVEYNGSYMHTKNYEWVMPHSELLPVGYEKTQIHARNYRLEFEPEKDQVNLYKIKSGALINYFITETMGGGSGTPGVPVVYSRANIGTATKYRVIKTR